MNDLTNLRQRNPTRCGGGLGAVLSLRSNLRVSVSYCPPVFRAPVAH